MRLGQALAVLILSGGWAEAETDLEHFRPMPRPTGAVAAGPVIRPMPRPAALATQAVAARPSLRPLPRPDFSLQTVALMPTPQKPAPQKPAAPLKGALCQRPGLSGKVLPPIKARNTGCNVAEPVLLSEISGVKLVPPATVDCEEARALSTWVATGLQPAFGGKIVRLNVVDSYACRPRNNVPGKPVSVHGLGQAIDIAGFMTSDGRTYTVADNYGPEIKAAQKAGCGIFRTTLGPGSDGYHENHLHLDVSHHGGSDYCH